MLCCVLQLIAALAFLFLSLVVVTYTPTEGWIAVGAAGPFLLVAIVANLGEILRQNPHHNIAKYLGCVANKQGRISGLVFVKYPITLGQMLRDGTHFDRQRCLRGIKAGISHLHGLGLIHNDINPENIMMDGVVDDMEPVIIDFDSCRKEDEKLGSKFGWVVDDEYAKAGER